MAGKANMQKRGSGLKTRSQANQKDNIKAAGNENLTILKYTIMALITVVLVYPYFLRGLTFQHEQLFTAAYIFFVSILYFVYKFLKKDNRFLETPIELAALGMVIVYFVSIFAAAGLNLAIIEWIKYLMYFALFFIVTDIIETSREKIYFLSVLVITSLIICLFGFDGITGSHIAGVINDVIKSFGAKNDLLFDLFKSGRVQSTLQYPNTLGAYLMGVYFIVLAMMLISSKMWAKMVCGVINFVLLLTFILTLSRGAYLIMPFAAVLFLTALSKGKRIKGFSYILASIIPAAAIMIKLNGLVASPSGNETKIWLFLLGGMVIAALFTLAAEFIIRYLEKLSWKVYLAAFISVAAVIIAGIVIAFNMTEPLVIGNTNAKTSNLAVNVKRSMSLTPGKSYKLVCDVSSDTSYAASDSFTINIYNQSYKDIIQGKETLLSSVSGKTAQGASNQYVTFTVPKESRQLNAYFYNLVPGTKLTFSNLKILNAENGSLVKTIPLKYKLIPESIYSRFNGVTNTEESALRMLYFKDGLKIFKHHWLIGAGGGGWELLYNSVQSYFYYARYTHNFYIQTAVETGVLGIIFVLFLLLTIIVQFIRGRQNISADVNTNILQTALVTAIFALFAHSAMDFDFSIASVFLFLWVLLAVFNSQYRRNNSSVQAERRAYRLKLMNTIVNFYERLSSISKLSLNPLICCIFLIIVITLPVSFFAAAIYSEKADNSYKSNDIDKAETYVKTAATLNPFEPSYRYNYLSYLSVKQNISQGERDTSAKYLKSAVKLGKHNADIISKAGAYYFLIGDPQKGLELFDDAIRLMPLNPVLWQNKADAVSKGVLYYYAKGDHQDMLKYADLSQDIVKSAAEGNKSSLVPVVFNEKTSQMVEIGYYSKQALISGNAIDPGKMNFYNVPSMDLDSNGIPDQWESSENVSFRVNNGRMLVNKQANDKDAIIKSRKLSLLPNTKYHLVIALDGNIDNSSIKFIILGIMNNYESLKIENNILTADFSTPGNLNDNNSLNLWIAKSLSIKDIHIIQQ